MIPWTAAYQAPPSMGFSRREYWSGVPLPSPISLPNKDKRGLRLQYLVRILKFYFLYTYDVWASLMAQMVKRLPAVQETTGVRSLGWEDPLEKEMATHSSTLACKIPWTEEPGRLKSMGSQRVGHD